MLDEAKDFTVTIDGPNGYRSWTFTPQQIAEQPLMWREVYTEQMAEAVRSEFERLAN
jgi:hypothetical protein